MKTFGGDEYSGPLSEEMLLFLTATNIGDRPTTITHFVAYEYSSFFSHLRHKPTQSYYITPLPAFGSVPYILNPGEDWHGMANQDSAAKEVKDPSRFYLGIFHNSSPKPVMKRLDLSRETNDE